MKSLLSVVLLAMAHLVPSHAQDAVSCVASSSCTASCGRFDKGDPRVLACENFCQVRADAQCPARKSAAAQPHGGKRSSPPARTLAKKSEVVDEREANGRMLEMIAKGNLAGIRRLIEAGGLDPTYVYVFDYDQQTREHAGRAIKLRLADLFNDTNELRSEEKGLDRIIALFIELGMDVTATLDALPQAGTLALQPSHTAWGPSLKMIERARDRDARMRAFEIALQHGLTPNADVGDWLFAELPQVCGRDRSQFAIQVVDLLIKYLGTSLQDDLWRAGERGPETLADVLDRMMSPGSIPRSNYERTQFAEMDKTWENCAPLSRRINRYLTQAN